MVIAAAGSPSPILAVGSLAFDTIQTPTHTAVSVLGGSVNYFSVAASFYTRVRVTAIVGEDFPEEHLRWLNQRGVDTSGVTRAPGRTFHWAGSYSADYVEATTLVTELNVFEQFDPVLSDSFRQTPYLFLANIDPEIQLRILDQMHRPRLVACDTMNFWIHGKREALLSLLRRVDLLCVNETEASLLSGKPGIRASAEAILALGPVAVVIKRGPHGAMLYTREWAFSAPAYPTFPVVDPTGAGDSFAGALMGYLAEAHLERAHMQQDPTQWLRILRRAVVAGSVMASFTVEDFSFKRLAHLQSSQLLERDAALIRMMSLDG